MGFSDSLRFVFSFLLICILANNLAPLTYAQTSPLGSSSYQQDFNSDVKVNHGNVMQSFLYDMGTSLSCMLSGINGVIPKEPCLTPDKKTGKLGYDTSSGVDAGGNVKLGGIVGLSTKMIFSSFAIPFHTNDYTSYLAKNFGIAPKTYANDACDNKYNKGSVYPNGIGYTCLNPLFDIWKVMLNLSYFFFVIVFVVVGFAVMLRFKLDGKVVIALQNQIPRMIVGILLVTFSYAIAGVLIDSMWVATFLGIKVIATADSHVNSRFENASQDVYKQPLEFVNGLYSNQGLNDHGVNGATNGLLGITADSSYSFSHSVISDLFSPAPAQTKGDRAWDGIKFLVPVIAGLVAGGVTLNPLVGIAAAGGTTAALAGTVGVGGVMSSVFGWLLSWVGGILAYLIILIAIIYALFRLWFTLIKAYISIIINTILAPLWITVGLIPGSKISFNTWIRSMVGNLAVYPAVVFLFLIGYAITASLSTGAVGAGQDGLFVPPLIGNPNNTHALGAIIGLGIILIAPNVVDMIQKAFGGSGGGAFAGLGAAIGVGRKGSSILGNKVAGSLMERDKQGIGVGAFARMADRYGKKPLLQQITGARNTEKDQAKSLQHARDYVLETDSLKDDYMENVTEIGKTYLDSTGRSRDGRGMRPDEALNHVIALNKDDHGDNLKIARAGDRSRIKWGEVFESKRPKRP